MDITLLFLFTLRCLMMETDARTAITVTSSRVVCLVYQKQTGYMCGIMLCGTFELSFSPLFCPSSSIPYHSLQDMGPSSMPSVPLMVGCGVSCTALLILLLIYAAFWRYVCSHKHIPLCRQRAFSLTIPAPTNTSNCHLSMLTSVPKLQ